MLNYRSRAIIKREIRQQVFTKKFIIMTLSLPVFVLLMIGLQFFIANFDREEHTRLLVLTESAELRTLLETRFADSELNNAGLYELHYEILAGSTLDERIDTEREALLSGALTGILFVPDSARKDKQVRYFSNNPGNQVLLGRLREQVNRAVVEDYFRALNLGQEAVNFARTNVRVDSVRITREGSDNAGGGNMVVAAGFAFLMYLSLLTTGPAVMAAVNEEKTNRVVEVLLSAVSPAELMYGKVVGTAITGLLQMSIWLLPAILLSLMSLPALAMMNTLQFNLEFFDVLYFLLNYVMGLLAFLSIFAAFGAMFDTPQDAQGSLMPVMMLIIAPFLLAFSMARNPANILAEVSSMLPFATIMVMPARMALIDVPLWQVAVALVVNLATIWFCIRGSARIYRLTILMTGKRPGWREIWKWLRYDEASSNA